MKHYINQTTNELFAFEEDGSQDHLIGEHLSPIDGDALVAFRAAQIDALPYTRKRVDEYPSIGDQLDALFHAGVFPAEMAAKIQAVKDKYPKD